MPEPQAADNFLTMRREYAAFLSYRHTDNCREGRQWASWLHHILETYEVPEDLVGTTNLRGEEIPTRLFPVFRDEEELPADEDLPAVIVRALESSPCLVVLCSPGAVASRFVADEITQFKAMGKDKKVIAAIISGEPNVAADQSEHVDGFASQFECFPEPLRFELDAEGSLTGRPAQPLAADFRLPDGSEGWINPEAHRHAMEESGVDHAEITRRVCEYADRLDTMKLKIIAGVLGVPLGVLTQRDKAYQLIKERQRTRNLRLWMAVVGVLAMLAIAAGVVAFVKQRDAEARKAEVIEVLAESDFYRGTRALESLETTHEGLALLARAVRVGQHQRALSRIWLLLQQRSFWLPVPANIAPRSNPPIAHSVQSHAQLGQFKHMGMKTTGEYYEPEFVALSENGQRVVTVAGNVVNAAMPHVRVWNVTGTPVTRWFEPEYSGMQYVHAATAQLSYDGRLVAIIADPWREPQYVEIREVETLKRLGDHLPALGRTPNFQGAAFSRVQFVRLKDDLGDEGDAMLLTVSTKGDAAVFRVSAARRDVWELARNRHRAPVVFASLDPNQEWLMSSCEDGDVFVSDISTTSVVGNPIVLHRPASNLERTEESKLTITLETGNQLFFELHSPLTLPLPNGTRIPNVRDSCVEWHTLGDAPSGEIVLTHTSLGHHVVHLSEREIGIRSSDSDADEMVTRRFNSDLDLVCLSECGDYISTSTADFATEIWTSDLLNRIGKPLLERRFFVPGETPATTRSVGLSAEGNIALIESSFWDPPNLGHQWFSLWDVRTGLLLTDRIHDVDKVARIDASGRFLVFLNHSLEQELKPITWLGIQPPAEIAAWIPDLAEAIGGTFYDRQGDSREISNRLARLQELLPRLARYHFGSPDAG